MRIISQLLICLLLVLTISCESEKKTYVSVVFDVEDYISPVEEGVDEIPKWLAETMTEVGVTGTFFVIGEKARSLENRGRTDVIDAMAKHDIGSHTNLGSIHPTVTELLEEADWNSGVQTMMENESIGFNELERIFKVPVTTLARHGGSYGPQLITSLGEMGKGYVYSPVHLPNHNAVWFCNALNFHGDYGAFDNVYYKDELFNPVFEDLKKSFQKDMDGMDVVAFFACHPTKVRAEQFWDFNFYEGANPGENELKAPALRPYESMATARNNFRKLMQYIKDQDYIEIVTFKDMMERFSYQPKTIRKKDLQRIASAIVANKAYVTDEYYSASEVFTALVQSLTEFGESGKVPRQLIRVSPLGPMEMPAADPEINSVSMDQITEMAELALQAIQGSGNLPSHVLIEGSAIGTGSLLHLFSQVYMDVVSKKPKDFYKLITFDPYPKENSEAIVAEVESYKDWIVHRLDLDMTQLVEFTKLQLWTMKPALEQ